MYLDPVRAEGGWQLLRNQHRLHVESRIQVESDEVLDDSPMRTALSATLRAFANGTHDESDFRSLRRIGELATAARERLW